MKNEQIDSVASAGKIKQFIDRIEKLEDERRSISEDIKDVYGEVKALGFEASIIRKIVSLRKKALERRREENELLELYMSMIGMEV